MFKEKIVLIYIVSLLVGSFFSFLYSLINNGAWIGCSVAFIIAFLITFLITNKLVQRPFTAIVTQLQNKMQENQQIMQNKIQQMQNRRGNPLGFESTMASMQKKSINEALKNLDGTKSLFKWNFLIKKQVNTLRFQLLYQNKNFFAADKLITAVMLMDHMTIGMVMTRAYEKNKSNTIEDLKNWNVSKIYKKSVWRLRGSNAAFLHSLYAWMLVKKGLIDEAIIILNKAVAKVNDGIISENLDFLKNNKQKHYNMTRYGDIWWSLYLQNPPKQKVKRVTR